MVKTPEAIIKGDPVLSGYRPVKDDLVEWMNVVDRFVSPSFYRDMASFEASDVVYSVGDTVYTLQERYRYECVASGGDLQISSGSRFQVMESGGEVDVRAFPVTTDPAVRINNAAARAEELAVGLNAKGLGRVVTSSTVSLPKGVRLDFHGTILEGDGTFSPIVNWRTPTSITPSGGSLIDIKIEGPKDVRTETYVSDTFERMNDNLPSGGDAGDWQDPAVFAGLSTADQNHITALDAAKNTAVQEITDNFLGAPGIRNIEPGLSALTGGNDVDGLDMSGISGIDVIRPVIRKCRHAIRTGSDTYLNSYQDVALLESWCGFFQPEGGSNFGETTAISGVIAQCAIGIGAASGSTNSQTSFNLHRLSMDFNMIDFLLDGARAGWISWWGGNWENHTDQVCFPRIYTYYNNTSISLGPARSSYFHAWGIDQIDFKGTRWRPGVPFALGAADIRIDAGRFFRVEPRGDYDDGVNPVHTTRLMEGGGRLMLTNSTFSGSSTDAQMNFLTGRGFNRDGSFEDSGVTMHARRFFVRGSGSIEYDDADNIAISRSNAQARTGTHSMRIDFTGGTGFKELWFEHPAQQGDLPALRFWYLSASDLGTFTVRILCGSAIRHEIPNTSYEMPVVDRNDAALLLINENVPHVSSGWTEYTLQPVGNVITDVAPSWAEKFFVQLGFNSTAGTDTAWMHIDDFEFHKIGGAQR
jgi:hypothetical protein